MHVKVGSRCQIVLYTVIDNTVFLMVVNMDSECSRTFGLPLHYLKLTVNVSGKASVLILALTGCWTKKTSNLSHNMPSEF